MKSSPIHSNDDFSEKDVPFAAVAFQHGLLTGLVFIIFSLIANILEFSIPTSIIQSVLMFLISLALSVVALFFSVQHHREQELGGIISFRRAFQVGLIVLATAMVLNTLFSLVYTQYIEPEFNISVLEATEDMMRDMGVDEAVIDKALEDAAESMQPANMLKQGLLFGLVSAVVLSAIVAAIMRRREED